MTPTIGRVVHYQTRGKGENPAKSKTRAAIVTAVSADGERVGLAVHTTTKLYFRRNVLLAPSGLPTPGCWNWPPLVKS